LAGSAWALSGKIITALMGLATYPLLSRLLAPAELGFYWLAYSIVLFGGTAGTMGLNNAVVRLVAERLSLNKPWQARGIVKRVFGFGLTGALGISAVYLLAGNAMVEKITQSPHDPGAAVLIAGWIVFAVLQQLVAETFRGFHEIHLATIFGGLFSGLIFAGSLAVIWLHGGAGLATVLSLAMGSAAASVSAGGFVLFNKIAALPARRLEDEVHGIGSVLRISWPLMVANLTHFAVTQADVWILGAFRTPEELAIYGAASRLMTIVVMPLMLLNAVVPPIITELHVQGKMATLENTLRSTAAIAGLPALIVLLAFIFLGKPILALIYGAFYVKGAVVLAVLSLGQIVNVWAGSCGITLMMTGNQTIRMAIAVTSAGLAVGGGVWAVQSHGMPGVAIASALTMICQNVAMVLFVKNKVGVWTHASFSGASWQKILDQTRLSFKWRRL
jgi:O-antigen/teichoic acid export membrane protein